MNPEEQSRTEAVVLAEAVRILRDAAIKTRRVMNGDPADVLAAELCEAVADQLDALIDLEWTVP